MNVYYQVISQVDKGSGDGICKGEDKDDGGKDKVGENNQTLPKSPKLLRFL